MNAAGVGRRSATMTERSELPSADTARPSDVGAGALPVRKCVHCHAQGRCVLESLSRKSRSTLEFHLRELVLEDGAAIFQQDEPAHRLYVVKSGTVVVCHQDATHQPVPVGLHGPGTTLGKLALFAEHRHVFSAASVGTSRVCSVSTQFLRTHPSMQRELAQALNDSCLQFQRELALWSIIARTSSVQDRMGQALQHLGRIQRSSRVHLPPHKVLACLLGTTRESVARTLTRLRKDKYLEKAGRSHVQLGPRLQVPPMGLE